MQQPYHSSPPDAGGVPQQSVKRPAQASSQHADAHIPRRSSSALLLPLLQLLYPLYLPLRALSRPLG